VVCHSARLRLSGVPRDTASSRSRRNELASLILADLEIAKPAHTSHIRIER
jgi:hypothetical protein